MRINIANLDENTQLRQITEDISVFNLNDGIGIVIYAQTESGPYPFAFDVHVDDEKPDKMSQFINAIHGYIFGDPNVIPEDMRKVALMTLNSIEAKLIENDIPMHRSDDEASKIHYHLPSGSELIADIREIDWEANAKNINILYSSTMNAKLLIRSMIMHQPITIPGEDGQGIEVDAAVQAARDFESFVEANKLPAIDYSMYEKAGIDGVQLLILKMMDILEIYQTLILHTMLYMTQRDGSQYYESMIKGVNDAKEKKLDDIFRVFVEMFIHNNQQAFDTLSDDEKIAFEDLVVKYMSSSSKIYNKPAEPETTDEVVEDSDPSVETEEVTDDGEEDN